MAKYALTNRAVADLEDIWNYTYEEWSETQANKYYTTLINTCQQLADKPTTGKPYTQIANNLLAYRIEKHIIFYQIVAKKANTSIEVIRILHESMDLRNRILES